MQRSVALATVTTQVNRWNPHSLFVMSFHMAARRTHESIVSKVHTNQCKDTKTFKDKEDKKKARPVLRTTPQALDIYT